MQSVESAIIDKHILHTQNELNWTSKSLYALSSKYQSLVNELKTLTYLRNKSEALNIDMVYLSRST